MIMTTTPGIDGKRVETYLDIVTGEAIMGANMVRDFLAGTLAADRTREFTEQLRVAGVPV